jgi:hypothetical protein
MHKHNLAQLLCTIVPRLKQIHFKSIQLLVRHELLQHYQRRLLHLSTLNQSQTSARINFLGLQSGLDSLARKLDLLLLSGAFQQVPATSH